MSGAVVAGIILDIIGVVLKRLPLQEQIVCRKALREAFVKEHLDDLDSYARSKKR